MTTPAFIVGNGPSLKETNLDLLVGHTSFGMNRIHLHYDKPGCEIWRPTHYAFVDYQTTMAQSEYMVELKNHIDAGEEIYVSEKLRLATYNKLKSPEAMPENIHFLDMCSRHFGGDYLSPSAPKRWHLEEPGGARWCGFASGLFVAMQVAADLGHSPLYLLGCDLGYKPMVGEIDPNHMDEGYVKTYPGRGVTGEKIMPPGYNEYTNAKLRYGHRVAKFSCEEMGLEVFNCTVGGKLEVYERKRLEDVV